MKRLIVGLCLLGALAACEQKSEAPVKASKGMTSEDVHSLIGMASSPIIKHTPVTPFPDAHQVRLYVAETGTTADIAPDARYVTLNATQRERLNAAFSFIERENPENAVHFGPTETQPRYLLRFVDAKGAKAGEVHISFCGEAFTSSPEIFSNPPAKGAQPFVNYETLRALIADLSGSDVPACS